MSRHIVEKVLSGAGLADELVIDCHCHLGPALYQEVPDSDPAGLARHLDELGIDTACVSSGVAMVSDWKAGNDQAVRAVTDYPDRFFGYTFYNPRYGPGTPSEKEMLAELERCFAAGLRGLKLHPDFHRTPADDPSYEPLYRFGHERELPILCHFGPGPLTDIPRYAQAVRRYRRAKFILAHSLPGRDRVDACAEAFGGCDNVFYCLANAFEPGVIEHAIARLGADKLLFGTDGCWGSMARRLGLVALAPIEDQPKRLLLGGNMRRIIESIPAG